MEGGWKGSLLFDSAAQPHETQQDATVWQQLPILEDEPIMRIMQYMHSPGDRAPAEAGWGGPLRSEYLSRRGIRTEQQWFFRKRWLGKRGKDWLAPQRFAAAWPWGSRLRFTISNKIYACQTLNSTSKNQLSKELVLKPGQMLE